MASITPAERRALRAKAHALSPVVIIGQHGLTPAVLHEIDVNLMAHELIKIRVFADQRADREAVLEKICATLGAEPVQHIGKLLIVWRKAEAVDVGQEMKAKRAAPAGRKAEPGTKSAARKSPQARRPRTPLARSPARPAPAPRTGGRGQPPTEGTVARREPSAGARRRRRGFSGP